MEPVEECSPGPLPVQMTLLDALEYETEFAVCASMLFIRIVQDRYEIGGGYGLSIVALDWFETRHFETLEQVENYLAEYTPYTQGARVWVPLPTYASHASEVEYLKKFSERGRSR